MVQRIEGGVVCCIERESKGRWGKKGPDGWMDKRGRGLLDLLAETRYKRLFWGTLGKCSSSTVCCWESQSHNKREKLKRRILFCLKRHEGLKVGLQHASKIHELGNASRTPVFRTSWPRKRKWNSRENRKKTNQKRRKYSILLYSRYIAHRASASC